ncbi:hypothetical protein BOW53_05930 [Solemya pervernicosa gill symbiont]|uniref:HMA domain-containing protein n=2 Tax=Gammaproteobacteria incertae sedis TaxID=118884 RepID=A0A1T2L711_9GAMM|nr:heavy-metal-associated domain-containing protein [Candidatus Reidiella endopervernicosa]OOZ40871.1 hypothetical protein BOW53_05930 [Solemya pervernicosa gill symbiont]QKQ26161.1 heavy-metal-associated domain-containing protein [Candidatus Reidiella endopervernicosa]
MKEQFQAQNIKCGGCADAIKNGLGELNGIEQVEVEVESGNVTVEGASLQRDTISAKLAELGYPEA